MLLIAGLGNPGRQYAGHRHNIGFMAADAISRRHSFSPWSKKFNALVSEGMLDGRKAVLIKPQTYMNNSGQAIGEAMRFYKLTAADLIVFYDELDLAPGKLRVKHGGGHGGHNGIKSINAHCGADYRRVRIGIGHPGDKARVNGHVLSDFAKADQQWLEPLLDAIADNIAMLAGGNDSAFMNKASVAVQSKAPASEKEASKPAPKGQSHIPQARSQTSTPPPAEGPMASMLKRLFGEKK